MDKIDKLLDAIEHPECYSDTEMETMLADPEVREVYDLLDKTKSSLASVATPDVDAEWDTFKNAHPAAQQRKSFSIINLFTRNVAASIAIGIASLAAVAAVVGVSVNYVLDHKEAANSTVTVAVAKEIIVANDTIVPREETPEVAPETIVFDNEPLEAIAASIADYYGYRAEFSTDAPKTLRLYFRWNQALTLEEVVESLNNFEQINLTIIDKTIKID